VIDAGKALREGAARYARGEFFEAHEAWEELWLTLDGQPRLFVQGLIQVAAACHKGFVQMQPNGCVSLLTNALRKLTPAPPDFMGVRTGALLEAGRAMLARAKQWRDGEIAGLSRADVPPIECSE
jgi:uncharacterized protein